MVSVVGHVEQSAGASRCPHIAVLASIAFGSRFASQAAGRTRVAGLRGRHHIADCTLHAFAGVDRLGHEAVGRGSRRVDRQAAALIQPVCGRRAA